MITANDAPANNLDNPVTEKNAAEKATHNATNPKRKVLSFILRNIYYIS